MQLIPVLDLKGGQVVHARMGDRGRYQPIASRLCAGASPHDVVNALLDVYPFLALYVADLDAIEGNGDHSDLIASIKERHPQIELWVDSGLSDRAQVESFLRSGFARPVLGSETLADLDLLSYSNSMQSILSLDFLGDVFRGPKTLLDDSARWPNDVIAMQLQRVGSGAGPDFARLRALRRRAPEKRLFAAGGVRGLEDLRRLAQLGVEGALVATALHEGALTRSELEAVASD
jgi:phosphoribosylformimino-5-aminoimidazole carboxamide ribotide isomerase